MLEMVLARLRVVGLVTQTFRCVLRRWLVIGFERDTPTPAPVVMTSAGNKNFPPSVNHTVLLDTIWVKSFSTIILMGVSTLEQERAAALLSENLKAIFAFSFSRLGCREELKR